MLNPEEKANINLKEVIKLASYETRLLFSESSQNISANTSVVTVTFQFRRTDYSHYSWSGNGSAYWNISCAGQNPGNTYFTFEYNMGVNVWKTVASRSFTVTHNADGALNVSASAKLYFGDGVLPGTLSAAGNFTCAVIPRYTSITAWKNTSVDQTSANFSWTCSNTVKAVHVSLNGGSWNSKWTGSAKSGTFTQTGLKPDTAYKIKIRVQRSDSSLWTTGSEITFKTKPIASISNTSIDMDIGRDLTLTFSNYANNASYLKLEVSDETGEFVQMASAAGIQSASYTWSLSDIASQLYEKCPARNAMPYRILYGVSLGGVDYTGTKTGVMKVTDSSPSFHACTCSNTIENIKNLLGEIHMPQNYGNMQVSITPDNKAIAKNAAAITKYVCDITCGSFNKKVEKDFSPNETVTMDLGAFGISGTYLLDVYAVDSRGNVSDKISEHFYVIPYHKPILDVIDVKRLNDYEAQTSLSLTGYYAKLMIGNVQKNSELTLKYRYCEVGQAFPSAYTAIHPILSDFNDDKKAVYSDIQFLQLDSSKSYNIEFVIADNLYSDTFTVTVSAGIAPMYIFEDGLVTVNKAPDFANTAAKLQVGGDIAGVDNYGNTRNLFNILHNFICDSETEPDQMIGGVWLFDEERNI